jgi:hypothetical protein
MADLKTIVRVLKVAGLQWAVDFYTGVLGFSVCWQTAHEGIYYASIRILAHSRTTAGLRE